MKRASAVLSAILKINIHASSLLIYPQLHHEQHIHYGSKHTNLNVHWQGPVHHERQKTEAPFKWHCPLTGHFQWEGVTFLHLTANSWLWIIAEPISGYCLLIGCIMRTAENSPGWDWLWSIMNYFVLYHCFTSHEIMWTWQREDMDVFVVLREVILHQITWSTRQRKAICNQVKTR